MIDKKNLDILKKIVNSKEIIYASFTAEKRLPNGIPCDYEADELSWLRENKLIKFSTVTFPALGTDRPYGIVETTPNGRALVEKIIKEKIYKTLGLIISALAVIAAFVRIYFLVISNP